MKKLNPLYVAPCPFCGALPISAPCMEGGPRATQVFCCNENCHARPVVHAGTEAVAVKRWNRRSGESTK